MKKNTRSVLEELYYAWLSADNAIISHDPDYRPTCNRLCREEEYLLQRLDEEGKEHFKQLTNANSSVSAMDDFAHFAYGFQLGMRLTLEVLREGA